MCGDNDNAAFDWDGFLEEKVEAPSDGPIPMDWPTTEDIVRLLKAAGSKWDAAGLQPPSQDGVLLPPGYPKDGDETIEEAIDRFAHDYRHELRDTLFRQQAHLSQTATEDLQSFLNTGISNTRKLKLTALLLKPNQVFGMHAHPTMELECTLRGVLGEVRLVGKDDTALDIPYRGPWEERKDTKKSLLGPNLSDLQGVYSDLTRIATWKRTESVTPGKYLFNEVGSIHKSYTEGDPFAGLVLWGGIHATIDPDKEGNTISNSDMLEMEST